MAPPSTLPRLPGLTPEDCADAVVAAVLARIGTYAFHLSPTIQVRIPRAERVERINSGLGLTVQQLTHWTQTGEGGDWSGPDEALDALHTVLEQLQTPAHARRSEYEITPTQTDDELRDPIEVLIAAAWARIQIESDNGVSPRALAALAGVNRRRVNQLLADRTVKRARDGLVAPVQARRLLASRVVGAEIAGALERVETRYCCGGGASWLVVRGELPAAVLGTAHGWERRGREWIARGRAAVAAE